MAHWVLHQIIVTFDASCNTVPLTYGMYIKECLVCKNEAVSIDNKSVGVYGRASNLFLSCAEFLYLFVEYQSQNIKGGSSSVSFQQVGDYHKTVKGEDEASDSTIKSCKNYDMEKGNDKSYVLLDTAFNYLQEYLVLLDKREARPPNRYYEYTCDMLYNAYMEAIKKTNKYWGNHRKQFSNALGELLFKVIQSSSRTTKFTYHLQCICKTWCKSLKKTEHEHYTRITPENFANSGFRFLDIPIVVEETQILEEQSQSIRKYEKNGMSRIKVYKSYSSALMLCLKIQNVDFVNVMLQGYRDFDGRYVTFSSPNFADSLGMTALHHACIWGNTNIVETILKYHQGW